MSRIVLHYHDRDIVRVRQNGRYQGFYRSTGRNSGQPGVWFPFDGIDYLPWFIKSKYSSPEIDAAGLHRLGTLENKKISERLTKERIGKGVEADEIKVNEFVGNKEKADVWRRVNKLLLTK